MMNSPKKKAVVPSVVIEKKPKVKYVSKLKEYAINFDATIIENFKGEVEYYIDKVNEEAHIVGTGSINFYTAQTGV